MIGDEHELTRLERLVDGAAGVRQHERADAEPAEHAYSEDDLVGRVPFVEMGSALHHDDGDAGGRADHERPRVPDGGRRRPAGNLAVRDLDRIFDGVGEPTETAAEHDADGGSHRRSLSDRGDRCFKGRDHVAATRRS